MTFNISTILRIIGVRGDVTSDSPSFSKQNGHPDQIRKNLVNFLVQLPFIIVDLLIVDSLIIVDRVRTPNVYFIMYFSHHSGFSH